MGICRLDGHSPFIHGPVVDFSAILIRCKQTQLDSHETVEPDQKNPILSLGPLWLCGGPINYFSAVRMALHLCDGSHCHTQPLGWGLNTFLILAGWHPGFSRIADDDPPNHSICGSAPPKNRGSRLVNFRFVFRRKLYVFPLKQALSSGHKKLLNLSFVCLDLNL